LDYYDGKIYSVLDAEQAMEFLSGIVFDDNPILVIIDIEWILNSFLSHFNAQTHLKTTNWKIETVAEAEKDNKSS